MANYDEKTGIHYGVISPNSISGDALNDICFGSNSTDPHYEAGKTELIDDLKQFCEDHYLNFDQIDEDQFVDQFNDQYENSGGQFDYEDSEYILHVSGDNFGIFVIKSPFYTYTRLCSPCAPGAGDLDAPLTGDDLINVMSLKNPFAGAKTYCLPREYFDEYSPIQYRYYNVSDDKEVLKPIIEVD